MHKRVNNNVLVTKVKGQRDILENTCENNLFWNKSVSWGFNLNLCRQQRRTVLCLLEKENFNICLCLFYFWSLYWLLLDLQLLITSLISAIFSYRFKYTIQLYLIYCKYKLPLYAIGAYHHICCEFESRTVRDVRHYMYVIKFVSDLLQFGSFLRDSGFLHQ
jgi:hypothetical protein